MLSLDSSIVKERLYRLIGRTRQSYSKAKEREIQMISVENEVLEEVRKWRRHHPKMGSRQTFFSLKESGVEVPMGVTNFEKLLSRAKMTVGQARRSNPKTSDGKGGRSYPNLTNGLIINDINQLVVADITYFWVVEKWYYLFTLKDVYSQRLISLIPSDNLEAVNAEATLKDLSKLRGKRNLKGCIHHSDNGSQYGADDFLTRLARMKMQISRAEECKQNGSSEQLNHIIRICT